MKSPRGRRPSRRTSSPARTKDVFLRPGQRLITPALVVYARKASGSKGVSTTVGCACTKSLPDSPDCTPQIEIKDNKVIVKCTMKGGCSACEQTTTINKIVMA